MKTSGTCGLIAIFLTAGACTASAGDLPPPSTPSRVVRLVVPFPPGGASDLIARSMRDPLGRALNRNCIVENRPGGSTVIAAEFVARAPADGHTLLVGGTALLAALRSNLPFDPIRDFAAVAGLGTLPYVFSVHPSGPAKDINDLIALARARPGKLAYASNGYGTMQHLTAELLMSRAAIRMKHVAFQGGGPAVMAALGGQVELVVSGIVPISAHVQSGRLRALAITLRARSPVLPDVPTVMESGLPDFDMTARLNTMAPAATPKRTINRLSAEIMRIVLLPQVKASSAPALALHACAEPNERYGSSATLITAVVPSIADA